MSCSCPGDARNLRGGFIPLSPHPLLLKLGHVQDTGMPGPAQPPANGFEARQEPDRSHPRASQRSRKELIFSASSGAKHNKIALIDMCLGNDIGFQLKQSKPQCSSLGELPKHFSLATRWIFSLFAWLPMLSSVSQTFSCLYHVNKELWLLEINILCRVMKCWAAFQPGQGCAEGPSPELRLCSRRRTQ